jgi:hypothetical protein
MKKTIVILVLVLFAAAAWSQASDSEKRRGLFVDFGVGGFCFTTYGSDADTILSNYASAQGADRIKVYIDLGLGWAVSPKLYVIANIDGFGDGFFAGSTSLDQLNSYLYSIGVRYYPFVTGLMLGVDAGASRLLLASNASAVGSTPWSAGLGATVAWDFGGKPTGWSLELGARAIYMAVSDPLITYMFGVTPFLNVVVK